MDLCTFLKTTDTSQVDFAAILGTGQSTISMIINGYRRPSPRLALRIQDATRGKVTVMELLYGQADRDAA